MEWVKLYKDELEELEEIETAIFMDYCELHEKIKELKHNMESKYTLSPSDSTLNHTDDNNIQPPHGTGDNSEEKEPLNNRHAAGEKPEVQHKQ